MSNAGVFAHFLVFSSSDLLISLVFCSDASDKLIQGKGKYEELEVCSHEIAACTAQLVVASKVKASKDSENLKGLQTASRGVATSTAQVVASAKTGAQLIVEGGEKPYSICIFLNHLTKFKLMLAQHVKCGW